MLEPNVKKVYVTYKDFCQEVAVVNHTLTAFGRCVLEEGDFNDNFNTKLVFNVKKLVLFATRQMSKANHLDSPDTYRIMNDAAEID